MPLVLIVLFVMFSFANSAFFSSDNLLNILRQSSIIGIAAIGATMVFISGGIDISQGAIMAFAGLAVVIAVESLGLSDPVAITVAASAGLAFGYLNGCLSERVRIPAFIATLGTALVIRGIAFVQTGGEPVAFSDGGSFIQSLGQDYLGPVPVPVVLMLALYGIAWFAMSRMTFGLHTYAIGSSESAARIAGVRVVRHRTIVYMLAGGFSALAGIILAGRLGSANPGLATGAEFDIITAVVLGGTSIYGGRGNILRTLLGAVFLATLANGLIIMNVPTFWQPITVGVVLLLALSLDRLRSSEAR